MVLPLICGWAFVTYACYELANIFRAGSIESKVDELIETSDYTFYEKPKLLKKEYDDAKYVPFLARQLMDARVEQVKQHVIEDDKELVSLL